MTMKHRATPKSLASVCIDTCNDTLNVHPRPYVQDIGHKRSLHFSATEVQSRVDLRRPDVLELQYTKLMMAFLVMQPAPLTIGMIGLGGGSLACFCHRQLPNADIEIAEINPHVIALRDVFAIPPDSERFRILEADGAFFVRRANRRFDVLLVDGYTGDGLAPSLSTPQFFDHCARALRPQGVLVMNLCTDAARRAEAIDRINVSFGGKGLSVEDRDRTNCVIYARKGGNLGAPPLGRVPRPADMNDAAWASLRGDFSRVLETWRIRNSAP
jgi:spermidine synthase